MDSKGDHAEKRGERSLGEKGASNLVNCPATLADGGTEVKTFGCHLLLVQVTGVETSQHVRVSSVI